MEFKAGDRVHVKRLYGDEVDFYATLKERNEYDKIADLVNCTIEDLEGAGVCLPTDKDFGPDKDDYYTLATDEEDTEEPEVRHVDDKFSFARSKNYETQGYIQEGINLNIAKNMKEGCTMPTIKKKKRMNKKEYAQFLIDNAEIIEITAGYRSEEKYDQNIKLEPLNNKTIPISKDILEVEIEEPITEDTAILRLVEFGNNGHGKDFSWHYNKSINEELDIGSEAFYIMNDDKTMTLIWTKEKGLVD